MKKILSLLMMWIAVSSVSYGQAPGIFNYQGVARNSVGNVLANKNITLRLTVHDGAAAGPVVYQESRAVTTNPFGLFNVQVGSAGATNVTGTIAGVNWGVGNKYIQVEIDPNGGTTFLNIGTAQMASVPYAWYTNLSGDLVLPFNKTQADAGTLFKITNSGTGSGSTALEGLTNSTASNVYAVIGTVTPTAPGGFSTGVRGINNGTGGLGIGVWGSQNGSGWGVHGSTVSGLGVYGLSTSGTGVYGNSTSGTGVYGISSTGRSGYFQVTNTSSTSPGVEITHAGAIASRALIVEHSGLGAGVDMQITNTASVNNVLQINNLGLGRGALIQSTNPANPQNILDVFSAGTGWAAQIWNGNAVNPKALRTVGGLQFTGINEALNRILASDAAGNATWQDPSAVGILSGSGTLNYVPKWTPNGTSLGNSQIFDNGTNIGIGTITPTAKVHLVNSSTSNGLNIDMTNASGARGINISHAGTGPGVFATTAGIALWGISTNISGAGVLGDNTTGEAVVGRNQGGVGVGAVVGRNDGAGYGVRGFNTQNGIGVLGQAGISGGTGRAGRFENVNAANSSNVLEVATGGTGQGLNIALTNAASGGDGINVNVAGFGQGVYSNSMGSHGVWGITNTISGAGILGDNTTGEAVVGRSGGGVGVGAVVGRNDGAGYGVRGFNTSNGIGVLGQAGNAGGTGRAGRFENLNAANSSNVLEVATGGTGSGLDIALTNAASGGRGINVSVAGFGSGVFSVSAGSMGVWGISNTISGAGILGDNTTGEAVVGRNQGGVGVGAVVGRNDGAGYGVRGFNTQNGIGVLGQAGISGGTGRGARFENVNSANTQNVVEISGNGTGTSLFVQNTNANPVNLAIFHKGGANVARIDGTGQIFANGGFTVGGADVAEYFDVEGLKSEYEAGDVLIISQSSDRKVEKSSTPYSTLVSGVYATKPGMLLTEKNATDGDFSQMIPLGVIGVIPTKVCLEGGTIKRGDLLVTSSIPGTAMKADPDKVRVGQVIGKALQDYTSEGIGKINVLVSIK